MHKIVVAGRSGHSLNISIFIKVRFSLESAASSAAVLNQKYSPHSPAPNILHPIVPEGALGAFLDSHSHFSNHGLCPLLKNLSSILAHTTRLYYFLFLLVNTSGLLCPRFSLIDGLASVLFFLCNRTSISILDDFIIHTLR